MTAWAPLFKNSVSRSAEFTGLTQTIAKPNFLKLNLAKSESATDVPNDAGNNLQSSPQEMPNPSENTNRRIAELEEKEAQLAAEIDRLHAEMDQFAKEHASEINTMAKTLAASLLRQHETLIETLKETLAACTASVLRPILSSAAADAAVRDFKRIINELVEGEDCVNLSVRAPEPFQQRLGDVLPKQSKIVPCGPDETDISISIGKEVITSRLAEWSQSIAGSDLDE